MKKEISIVWFRQDLRLSDNPAFVAAAAHGEILPVYILDDCAPVACKMGNRSKIWLHHSLKALQESLGGNLNLYKGNSRVVMQSLIEQYDIKNIFLNSCYEPWHAEQEDAVKVVCNQTGVAWHAFNGNYMWSPEEVLKNDRSFYKVFTAYKNKTYGYPPRVPSKIAKNVIGKKDNTNKITLSDFDLLSESQQYQNIESVWAVGEKAAQKKLTFFIKNNLSGYKQGRDYPAQEHTSKLSPYLHFGEISPAQIWHAVDKADVGSADKQAFLSELIWREFSCYLLHHFKALYKDNFKNAFDNFAWKDNQDFLKAWQSGMTGYPLVDAGMRQLLQTGYMHNRVRMVVASFLIKNLNIHWHEGRDWFWDCLVDADLANNSMNWQWVAGSGVDAAPYFRIFNPTTQGEKFDRDGDYTRKFVPELKNLSNKYLFKPWTAPEKVLEEAGIVLGKTYPKPIVDFAGSRKKALELYKKL
ncbi:MAG TPA: deoxyribodipyrimidine photo-lyase [Candidatus Babeliales bacterium]|nr:deoxyribodipyrimidine photo-lyase [Candidatus Babeliales bacterium]